MPFLQRHTCRAVPAKLATAVKANARDDGIDWFASGPFLTKTR